MASVPPGAFAHLVLHEKGSSAYALYHGVVAHPKAMAPALHEDPIEHLLLDIRADNDRQRVHKLVLAILYTARPRNRPHTDPVLHRTTATFPALGTLVITRELFIVADEGSQRARTLNLEKRHHDRIATTHLSLLGRVFLQQERRAPSSPARPPFYYLELPATERSLALPSSFEQLLPDEIALVIRQSGVPPVIVVSVVVEENRTPREHFGLGDVPLIKDVITRMVNMRMFSPTTRHARPRAFDIEISNFFLYDKDLGQIAVARGVAVIGDSEQARQALRDKTHRTLYDQRERDALYAIELLRRKRPRTDALPELPPMNERIDFPETFDRPPYCFLPGHREDE